MRAVVPLPAKHQLELTNGVSTVHAGVTHSGSAVDGRLTGKAAGTKDVVAVSA